MFRCIAVSFHPHLRSPMAAATVLARSRSAWTRLLSLRSPPLLPSPSHLRPLSSLLPLLSHRHFCADASSTDDYDNADRVFMEINAEADRERQREREERRRAAAAAGVEYKEAEEEKSDEDEDYMGVDPLIEKLQRQSANYNESLDQFWEPTDSESDEDDDWVTPEEEEKMEDEYERKFKRYEELFDKFEDAETLDEAHKLRMKIEKFHEKHCKLPMEYRVIGDLMNRFKESTGKERFVLIQKLNRAMRIMEVKEAYDPNNPANFGIIQQQLVASPDDIVDSTGSDKQKETVKEEGEKEGEKEGDKKGEKKGEIKEEKKTEIDDDEFDEDQEEDDKFTEKINAIEKKIEEKLALLDHTFGKKGRVLEQEIKDLVEERNVLTEKKKRPLYRKGFDVKVINVNRTCKVTKGGQLAKYSAILATGNYNGVVGFARAKGPTAKVAIQRAYEKCFQNLHYMERYEEHTIAHAIQAQYEKTKIYLWPGPLRTGMCAGRTVETVLYLAGFSNVKSKIIGSRNPLNVIKALFKALNAIETPKDVQEKFGRTVVESYLMH